MSTRARVAAAIGAAAVAAAAAVLVASSGSSRTPSPEPGAAMSSPATAATRFGGAREDCSTRSEAEFPGAFTDPRNLVVGPLVLVGGAYTDAATAREFGGNKFPLFVKAGHTVTVRLATRGRRSAGLGYGPQPQGEGTLRDTYRSVTFVACKPGKAPRYYSANGPSGTYADDVNVTFWSGFVLTRRPACIPLDIYVDDAASPLRVGLALGRRCT
jgi:hypothetical protein